MSSLLATTTEGVTTFTLNRPEKRNAMNGELVQTLLQHLQHAAMEASTRVLIINGKGHDFCAGADIAWMQTMATASEDDNYKDAQALADLLYALYTFPKPTIVLAHGAVRGGGLGLLAGADIVLAAKNTSFAFTEVKIALAPAVISPYIIAAIGERAARYYFLTGNVFDVEEAYRLTLVHQVVAEEALWSVGALVAQTLVSHEPTAMAMIKQVMQHVIGEKISEKLAQRTAEYLAELRSSPAARAGLQAFLEKRK